MKYALPLFFALAVLLAPPTNAQIIPDPPDPCFEGECTPGCPGFPQCTQPPPPPPPWYWCGYCGCEFDECVLWHELFESETPYENVVAWCDSLYQHPDDCVCEDGYPENGLLDDAPPPMPWLDAPEALHAALEFGMGQAMAWRPIKRGDACGSCSPPPSRI